MSLASICKLALRAPAIKKKRETKETKRRSGMVIAASTNVAPR
jgi:hypothetical protein